MRIEITKGGIYNQNGPVPVGTQMDVPDNFKGWANKYRVISTDEGKSLEPATPDPDDLQWENPGLDSLRDKYERTVGKRPGPRMKEETMLRHIEEAGSTESEVDDES